MNLMTQKLAKACIPVAATLALLAGCHAEKEAPGYHAADDFLKPDEVSHVTRIAEQQIAAGARTDGTLRPYHFSKGKLNSLGQEKLDYMLKDVEADDELVVYIDVPTGDSEAAKTLADARQDAVTDYLLTEGLAEDSFRLETGFNPDATVSVVPAKTAQGNAPAAAGHSFGGGLADSMTKK